MIQECSLTETEISQLIETCTKIISEIKELDHLDLPNQFPNNAVEKCRIAIVSIQSVETFLNGIVPLPANRPPNPTRFNF